MCVTVLAQPKEGKVTLLVLFSANSGIGSDTKEAKPFVQCF